MLRDTLDLQYLQRLPQPASEAGQADNHLQVSHSLNRMASNENGHRRPAANPPIGFLGPRGTRPPSTAARLAVAADENNAVMCNCGQAAVLLTVRKDGPNQGRQFYKCSASSCNFFLWADQQAEDRNSAAPGSFTSPASFERSPIGFHSPEEGRGQGHYQSSSRDAEGGGSSVCNCNQLAITRTVQKDGPNKGRQFHTCPKPRDQQCGFFLWADENVAPGEAGRRWLGG